MLVWEKPDGRKMKTVDDAATVAYCKSLDYKLDEEATAKLNKPVEAEETKKK